MKEILTKLVTVKSLVTLALTAVFCYLAAARVVGADLFLTVYTVIISFYFGTQYERGKGTDTTQDTAEKQHDKEMDA